MATSVINHRSLGVASALAHADENPESNLLLAALPATSASLLDKYLRQHEFDEGTVLWRAGFPAGLVFFPVSGIITIGVPTQDGHVIEVAIIGREGAAGFHDRSGMLPVATQGVILAAGRFMSISPQIFTAAEHESEDIRRMAEVCTGWLLLQSQQMAACNAVHPAEARLCRWLLRASDALDAETISVTQEMIAHALGIRRTTA